jgi:hypothetical protein
VMRAFARIKRRRKAVDTLRDQLSNPRLAASTSPESSSPERRPNSRTVRSSTRTSSRCGSHAMLCRRREPWRPSSSRTPRLSGSVICSGAQFLVWDAAAPEGRRSSAAERARDAA